MTGTVSYVALAAVVLAGVVTANASAGGAQLNLERCRKVHPEARCGKVPVPLERGNPASRQIGIHVTVLRHTNRKRPPLTPVYVIYGGPGFAPSFSVEGGLFLLEGVRRRHDLVMVDYRGEGRSDAVNCRPLQRLETSNTAAIQSAVGACGAQLGSTADDYGAADVADDVEAVRAAFGHPLINVYGQSYGTVHAQAYALRHGPHLRSLILDGAFSPLAYDTDTQAGGDIAAASARSVALICRRSPSCARYNPRPARALARLAGRLRARPFRGVGRDALGDRKRVRMNEAMLARIVGGGDFAYIGQSEVPAAAAALRNGDRRPLLRLAAFTGPDFVYDAGYRRDSAGMGVAGGCADIRVPWDVNASVEQRRAQAAAAWAALPQSTFSPFSPQGWLDYWESEVCVEWPAPADPEPVFVPGSPSPMSRHSWSPPSSTWTPPRPKGVSPPGFSQAAASWCCETAVTRRATTANALRRCTPAFSARSRPAARGAWNAGTSTGRRSGASRCAPEPRHRRGRGAPIGRAQSTVAWPQSPG